MSLQSQPVVLILGSGPRIGASVAQRFASLGYKVAVTSRKGTNSINNDGYLSLKADLTVPDTVSGLFDTVQNEFKAAPSVVIYNAAAMASPPDKDSVLSLPASTVASDLNVNTISPYVAAQQAVSAWDKNPTETKKTFIYTGNILNVSVLPVPAMLDLGMGKSASAYWIGVADMMYTAKNIRFFYTDERHADGKNKGMALDGDAHAEFYAQLANHEGNVPWHATFVKSQGYVQFK